MVTETKLCERCRVDRLKEELASLEWKLVYLNNEMTGEPMVGSPEHCVLDMARKRLEEATAFAA